jgi:muconolactone delta-isomerase
VVKTTEAHQSRSPTVKGHQSVGLNLNSRISLHVLAVQHRNATYTLFDITVNEELSVLYPSLPVFPLYLVLNYGGCFTSAGNCRFRVINNVVGFGVRFSCYVRLMNGDRTGQYTVAAPHASVRGRVSAAG